MNKKIFVAEIDGEKFTRTSNHDYVAAVLAKDKNGWGMFSCHETWEAAEKSERKAISWMEKCGCYTSVAIVGVYQQ